MPVYQTPGVYVEEVSSGSKPIAGVGTSTAGFVGYVAESVEMPTRPGTSSTEDYSLAPVNEPQLISNWERFKTTFGDFQEGNSTLAHAVYGFFNNGGTRCWVTRIGNEVNNNVEDVRAALNTFKAIDEIAIVAVPGAVSDAVQNAILDHCQDPYLQDRFAILDGRHEGVSNTNLTKEAIQGGTRDESYGAIYFPWIQVYDPIKKENNYVPPSGHLAGIYARVDTERGVHKAPANEVIRGVLGVEVIVNKEEQAGLNPEGINILRKFNGNITVWGARTLASKEDNEWKYINVRRLFLYLRESIDEGTQWVVFEPNDSQLWAKIKRNVAAFLTNVWRDGALFGNTPAEAFYVKCDEETNPPEVRDLGQVITEVGVAVVKPAEFVIFRISQWAGPEQNP